MGLFGAHMGLNGVTSPTKLHDRLLTFFIKISLFYITKSTLTIKYIFKREINLTLEEIISLINNVSIHEKQLNLDFDAKQLKTLVRKFKK